MYTENTTENLAIEKTGEVVAEIKKEDIEAETEKEIHRSHLIETCTMVIPEESPDNIALFIRTIAEYFPINWILEASNEAPRRNKRSLQGALEILDMRRYAGHDKPSGSNGRHT
jgi:hypothetical protein